MSFLQKKQHKKAVAYYRHSAEDKQENSVPLQREFVRKFLADHNVLLIHEEADEGVSGLTTKRPAFQRLLHNWILNRDVEAFDYVVFYDVSRLGRFEDSDEAGHFAYECKQRGKEVIYARRGFPVEGQKDMSQVQTAFERWMSFKYSEKLSEDVIRGCIEISGQGYSVGGKAPYGMARQLLSVDRKPLRLLEDGEHKSVANERVIFVPKGDDTTRTIGTIFERFLDKNLHLKEIADELNREGTSSPSGYTWDRSKVYRILSNPVYKGTHIYNKNWGRLKRKKHRNPVSDWVIRANAFPAIIEPERFDFAQECLHWLLPSHYLRGYYLLRKCRRSVISEIQAALERNGHDKDEARSIPLAFAIKRWLPDQTPYWCFMISQKIEQSKEVLCVSVDMDKDELVDRTFLIPSTTFNLLGMRFLAEKDDAHSCYLLKEEQIEPTILSFVD